MTNEVKKNLEKFGKFMAFGIAGSVVTYVQGVFVNLPAEFQVPEIILLGAVFTAVHNYMKHK
jgi:hypothetical protein